MIIAQEQRGDKTCVTYVTPNGNTVTWKFKTVPAEDILAELAQSHDTVMYYEGLHVILDLSQDEILVAHSRLLDHIREANNPISSYNDLKPWLAGMDGLIMGALLLKIYEALHQQGYIQDTCQDEESRTMASLEWMRSEDPRLVSKVIFNNKLSV